MNGINSILIVDDDELALESLSDCLMDAGYKTSAADSVSGALDLLESNSFDVVVTDLRLGLDSGFDIIRYCKKRRPETAIIVISGYGTAELALQAIREGAFDFLTKPVLDNELQLTIHRALEKKKQTQSAANQKTSSDEYRYNCLTGLEDVIGRSDKMQRAFDIVKTIANAQTPVMISGERGVGKSTIARAIHRLSSRKDKPFIEVPCGALAESLLESELFGNAFESKIGKFQQADGGTILLDEISTVSPAMQVKLLRVLQESQFEPVGSSQSLSADVRVILSTNENLYRAVQDGRFRQDLYYRISVINIDVPPLRERVDDIPLLAQYFLKQTCQQTGRAVAGFSDAAMSAMSSYRWQDNVRELQNAVERAVLLGKSEIVMLEDLPGSVRTKPAPAPTMFSNAAAINGGDEDSPVPDPSSIRLLKDALEEPERKIILDALRAFQWNRIETAAALGINRTTLYKKMKRLNLEEPGGFGF
ncbi:MAG: sigma-54-dependent Fis family transcriptional regulator [Thermoguttaceae bacterium]|nr:sigma-54-dependent Fis family transcriptional regulator [Thermoguttaceae bacterium]